MHRMMTLNELFFFVILVLGILFPINSPRKVLFTFDVSLLYIISIHLTISIDVEYAFVDGDLTMSYIILVFLDDSV